MPEIIDTAFIALMSANYKTRLLNLELFYRPFRTKITIFNKVLKKLSVPAYFIQTTLPSGGMVDNITIYTTREETSWL